MAPPTSGPELPAGTAAVVLSMPSRWICSKGAGPSSNGGALSSCPTRSKVNWYETVADWPAVHPPTRDRVCPSSQRAEKN